jgi:hypothetical protein
MVRLPPLILEAAWDSDPLSSSPVYQRIQSGILYAQTSRGRNFRLDRTDAGTATIRLADYTGELNPNYTGSPFYGLIDIGKRIRLSVELFGHTYRLFTGFLRALPRSYPGIKGREVEIKLSDAFLRLAKHKVTTADIDDGSDMPEEASGWRVARMLDYAGFPGTGVGGPGDPHRDLDEGSTMIASMGIKARSALEHILHIEQTEMGRFYMAGDGQAVWLARHSLLSHDYYTTPQVVFGGPSGIPYQDIQPDYSDDLLYTSVTASRVGGDVQSVEDADAVADYGSTVLDRGELLSTSDSELSDLIYYLLDQHKRPVTRFRSIRTIASADLSILEELLNLELSYRATVNHAEPDLGFTETQAVSLENIGHTIDYRAGSWLWDCALSDADSRRYWILGDPVYGVLGSTTRWAY